MDTSITSSENAADEFDSLPEGSVVGGRYKIVRQVGRGGMGTVYLAKDHLLDDEEVAIKILHTKFAFDQRQIQRFLREVQIVRRVNHRNVVRTYDVGVDRDLVYFTMEYIVGESLEALIANHTFERNKIANLIIQICEALDAIHSSDIMHRDLKPANILVLADGSVKITDFGIARSEYSNLTAHNEIIGSATYMAPEIWLARKLTPSVDLYSLGILLYELVMNELPFVAETPAALMRLHLDKPPRPPKEIDKDVAPWLNKLIVRLLEKSPEDRPVDAKEVIHYVKLQTGRQLHRAETAQAAATAHSESDSLIAKLEELSQHATAPRERERSQRSGKRPSVIVTVKNPTVLPPGAAPASVRALLYTFECSFRNSAPLILSWLCTSMIFAGLLQSMLQPNAVRCFSLMVLFSLPVMLLGRGAKTSLSLRVRVLAGFALSACVFICCYTGSSAADASMKFTDALSAFSSVMLLSPAVHTGEATRFLPIIQHGALLTLSLVYGGVLAGLCCYTNCLQRRNIWKSLCAALVMQLVLFWIEAQLLGLVAAGNAEREFAALPFRPNIAVVPWTFVIFNWIVVWVAATFLGNNRSSN